jgi:hypothetical protein
LEQNVGSCIPLQVAPVDVTVVLVVCVVCVVVVVLVFEIEVKVEVAVVALSVIVTEVVSVSVADVDVAVAVVKVTVTGIHESQCIGHSKCVASPTDPGRSHSDLATAHSGGSRSPLHVAVATVYVVEVVVASTQLLHKTGHSRRYASERIPNE